jgi:alkylation response protein AidB-like acyl-CoA dehydrogenase
MEARNRFQRTADLVPLLHPGALSLVHISNNTSMSFSDSSSFLLTPGTQQLLEQLDAFIEAKIKPLQARDDNERFFDYRREWARTDWERGGVPKKEWGDLLEEMRQLADKAGFWRLAMPRELGGQDAGNLTSEIPIHALLFLSLLNTLGFGLQWQ